MLSKLSPLFLFLQFVTHRLPSGAVIEIRKVHLGRENRPLDYDEFGQDQGRHEVTYHIGFTFGGPVAYNVEVFQPSIVDKIKKIHN